MVKILMVCLGNICRSPMAEGLMREKLRKYDIHGEVDSCGFEEFHAGDHPDRRAIETAKKHGVDISQLKARLFKHADFDDFDHIFVMDRHNYMDVEQMSRNDAEMEKVDFIMNAAYPGENNKVPDPYSGTMADFEKTWALLEEATEGIIHQLKNGKISRK